MYIARCPYSFWTTDLQNTKAAVLLIEIGTIFPVCMLHVINAVAAVDACILSM